MKAKYKCILVLIGFLISNHIYAQPVRSGHINNSVKKQPTIKLQTGTNGIRKASINAKIHANSNSVFGNGNTHPYYNNKNKPGKNEGKEGEMKNNKEKKQKK